MTAARETVACLAAFQSDSLSSLSKGLIMLRKLIHLLAVSIVLLQGMSCIPNIVY